MERSLQILMTADAIGGVWTYALELAAALAPHGVSIALATMGALPTAAQRADARRVENLELFTSEHRLEWMEEPWEEVDAAGEWLLELAQSIQPQLVHLNGFAHAALPWHAPVVVIAHSCVLTWWEAVKREPAPAWWAEYARRVDQGLRAADLIVAPTLGMLEALERQYTFSGARRVIPNCRQSSQFLPGRKAPIIFTAGRCWDEAKNIELLERIAPAVDWPIHIAGAERGAAANAQHLGRLDSAELAARLSAAAIYAAPALYEPFGLGILEAALTGCALVLSDLPSLRENWQDVAVFVSPTDEAGWICALNTLGRHPERCARLGEAARQRGLEFTPARTGEAYLGAYHELLLAARSPRDEALLPI